jgi:hypothetical protein
VNGTLSLRGGAARLVGPNRLSWDTERPESIARCEAIWSASARDGLMFYNGETLTDMPRADVRAGFDPETAPRETIIVAPMAGG